MAERTFITQLSTLLVVFVVLQVNGVYAVSQAELSALQDFYSSTNGQSWIDNSNWESSKDPCGWWFGVACDANNRHVVGLYLAGNGLSGTLSLSLSDLYQLNTFNIANNSVGGQLPWSLAEIKSLHNLQVDQNIFNGEFPPSLGNLLDYELSFVNASNNRLQGTPPAWLGEAEKLRVVVDLHNNYFSCPIPSYAVWTGANCISVNITLVQPNCAAGGELVAVFGGPWPQSSGLRCVFNQTSVQAGWVNAKVITCETPSFSRCRINSGHLCIISLHITLDEAILTPNVPFSALQSDSYQPYCPFPSNESRTVGSPPVNKVQQADGSIPNSSHTISLAWSTVVLIALLITC